MEAMTPSETFRSTLHDWLLNAAFPIWWKSGADHESGGFYEELDLFGAATDASIRGRIQPRQIFCFAKAEKLGWAGPAAAAVRHGLDFMKRAYRTPDGTYVSLASKSGDWINEATVLYDQAFALLAFAATADAFPEYSGEAVDEARSLLGVLNRAFASEDGGFFETPERSGNLLANSHMHLFEAALELEKADGDGPWSDLADRLALLALTRFGGGRSDRIYEHFSKGWIVAEGAQKQSFEPGHQFEWAHLLLAWAIARGNQEAVSRSSRLFETGENLGVDPALTAVVAEVCDDGSVANAMTRLWPQVERYRAALAFAECSGCGTPCPRTEAEYRDIAEAAATCLRPYLIGENDRGWQPGLWHDKLKPDGTFVLEPAPASSFYHIVSAMIGPVEAGHLPAPAPGDQRAQKVNSSRQRLET